MSNIYAIDFDGTIVSYNYPDIGQDIGAIEVLKFLQDRGDRLILSTCRSGRELLDAVAWCYVKGIKFYGVNHNPDQEEWSSSPKVYATYYIDDRALGVPLKIDLTISNRPFVDWEKIKQLLNVTTAAGQI